MKDTPTNSASFQNYTFPIIEVHPAMRAVSSQHTNQNQSIVVVILYGDDLYSSSCCFIISYGGVGQQ
ncbi:hypothetical protein EON65_19005 [archaeon]|nr:MAG: hypothetical protein EON65_19005 [archaeon]